jgi:Na+/H+ antiporter NhaD/arsenite permease-like protein
VTQTLPALLIIIITLIGVALGRYPWLRMNRATIALVGATALVAVGILTLPQAYALLDLDTLVLLLAMMIINANLRLAGFFGLIGRQFAGWAHSPKQLLAWIMVATGISIRPVPE